MSKSIIYKYWFYLNKEKANWLAQVSDLLRYAYLAMLEVASKFGKEK